ncbi:MAG TPA: hypothetical protein VET89_05320 [Stellaceae bacterium]|nr:hypothetical protein [Stellaceae bacterium]
MAKNQRPSGERPPLVADAIPPALRRRGVTPRQVFAAILVGALVLAVFASRDTPGWAERLGDTPLAHQARGLAIAWDERMARLGLAGPHEFLRAAMQRLLDWKWGDDNR